MCGFVHKVREILAVPGVHPPSKCILLGIALLLWKELAHTPGIDVQESTPLKE